MELYTSSAHPGQWRKYTHHHQQQQREQKQEVQRRVLLNIDINDSSATRTGSTVISRSSSSSSKIDSYQPDGIQSGPDPCGVTTVCSTSTESRQRHEQGQEQHQQDESLSADDNSFLGSYVSSVVYSAIDNTVVLTGHTYGRFFASPAQRMDEEHDVQGIQIMNPIAHEGCFLASVRLADNELVSFNQTNSKGTRTDTNGARKKQNKLVIAWKQHLNNAQVDFKYRYHCNTIHMYNTSNEFLIIGNSEELKKVVDGDGEEHSKLTGMILDFSYNRGTGGEKSFRLHGGKKLQSLSPIGVTSFIDNNQTAFVLFLDDAGHGVGVARYEINESKQHHDTFKGSSVVDSILRLDETWLVEYFTLNQTTPAAAAATTTNAKFAFDRNIRYVARSITAVGDDGKTMKNTLVVVGNTFNVAIDSGETNDLDGFVTKVNPSTGAIEGTTKISLGNGGSVAWIEGMCYSSVQPKFVYIVGGIKSTTGLTSEGDIVVRHGSRSVFIIKMDVKTLRQIWYKQLDAAFTVVEDDGVVVRANSCAVTPDGQSVWVAGTISNNGVVTESGLYTSYGDQDIFIGRYQTKGGILEFVHQIGSSEHDDIASNFGLTTDTEGNAILAGTTLGSFYRERSSYESRTASDVFVMTISRQTGEMKAPINHYSGLEFLSPTFLFDISFSTRKKKDMFVYMMMIVSFMLLVTMRWWYRKFGCSYFGSTNDRKTAKSK